MQDKRYNFKKIFFKIKTVPYQMKSAFNAVKWHILWLL